MMDWDEQWEAIQEALYHTTRDQLNRFAADHSQERFSNFAFDCNADYGEVLLCLNTKAHLEASAPPDQLNRYRWQLGDWKYTGFNTEGLYEAAWESAWRQYQDAIADVAFDDEEIPVRLLVELCLVLMRLDEDDAFLVLNREPDFATIVMEHEDNEAEAFERMKIVREMVEEAASEGPAAP